MYDYKIYSMLKKYAKAKKGFHIPGHKGSGEFKGKFGDASLDITELTFSDNLHSPKGVIAEAERDIAGILGAKRSYITTDGSTSGIFAMLHCAARIGNKIIVFRNSHASVWNACSFLGLEPLVVQGPDKEGILQPPTAEIIERLVSNDPNIVGLLATSPDYYGTIAPLGEYAEVLKKYNRFLFVDGAHGSHLAFYNREIYAGKYADMWVDGAHKTLPSLTQGAIVNVNNEELLGLAEGAMDIFRTTSPSYPIMASVEYGVKYLANSPKNFSLAKDAAEELRADESLTFVQTPDWTKLLLDFKPLGVSPDKVLPKLEKKGIYPEFSDGRYILFYLSPMTSVAEIKGIKNNILKIIKNKKLKNTFKERPHVLDGERSYAFQYAIKRPSEWVELNQSIGRICAKNAGLMPPCIPVVVTGEVITSAAVDALTHAKSVYGIRSGKICVVRKW